MGIYLPGLVRGANQATSAYTQGRQRASQQAYQLALQNLRAQTEVQNLATGQQRGLFYDALLRRHQQEDQSRDAKARYYVTKYGFDPNQDPGVLILQGEQRDRETGAGQAPSRETPQARLNIQGTMERRLRQQLLDEARAQLAESPRVWKLNTLESYLQAKFPRAPNTLRRAAAVQAWTEAHRGIGGLLQGGATVEPPPEIDQAPAPESPAAASGGGIRDLTPDDIDQDTLSQDVGSMVQQGHPDEAILAQFKGAPQALQDLAREALMRAKGVTTAAVG